MPDYDAALKLLLKDARGHAMEYLTGRKVKEWLDTELPPSASRRADLVCAAWDDSVGHVELQSRNDSDMDIRMYQYGGRIHEHYRIYPWQLVLYVGEAPMSMPTRIKGPFLDYYFQLVDFRDLDGEPMLESAALSDNILAVLMRLRDQRQAVREIVNRIAKSDAGRVVAMDHLATLAGLRRISGIVEEEGSKVPITESILEHELFGPLIRRGVDEGVLIGRQEGRQEGVLNEAFAMARRVVVARFGPAPPWLDEQLRNKSARQLEDLVDRSFQVGTIDELFR